MVIQFSTLKVWSKKRWRTPKTARHQKEENVIVSRKIFPRARRGQPGRSASEANLLAAEVSDDDIYIMVKCLSVCLSVCHEK